MEPVPRTCPHCGAAIAANASPRRIYCSRRCSNRASEQARSQTCTMPGCDRPYRAKGLCGGHWNQRYAKREQPKHCECAVCGAEIERLSNSRYRKACSYLCRYYLEYGRWPACDVPATHISRRSLCREVMLCQRPPVWMLQLPRPVPKPLRKRWYAGCCITCGKAFIHDQPTTRSCSLACARVLGHARRRALKRMAFVEVVYRRKVFERDGWRCQLCRKPVARTKAAPHPRAPVLDHIVPLAAGGTHEPANVQCAHFLCNSLKRDGAWKAGEQLMLIG